MPENPMSEALNGVLATFCLSAAKNMQPMAEKLTSQLQALEDLFPDAKYAASSTYLLCGFLIGLRLHAAHQAEATAIATAVVNAEVEGMGEIAAELTEVLATLIAETLKEIR